MNSALREYFESPDFINDLGLLEGLKEAVGKRAKRRVFSTYTDTVYYYIENGDDGDMGIIDGRLERNLDALRASSEKAELVGVITDHFRLLAKAQGLMSSSSSSSSGRKTKRRGRTSRRH
jgi:hypothetical protein